MNEKPDVKETAQDNGQDSLKNNNKPLFFGIIAGVLVLNTVMALVLFQVTKPKNPELIEARAQADSLRRAAEKATAMGAISEMAIEAVVNIAGTDGERFLKAAIIFEYDDRRHPGMAAELARRTPRFKDLFLDHLSKLTLFDVTESDARDKIRKDLLRLFNNSLPADVGEIRDVLFTQYIIQ